MDKLERLLTLTATLLTTSRPLTADELRRRIGGYPEGDASFRRAFERDKDDLREMGIPLLVEEAPGTDPPVAGYRIRRDDYYLRDPGFAPDELAALHLAASLVRLGPGEGDEGLWKLGGAAGALGDDGSLAALPGDARLAPIFAAVADRSVLELRYRGERRQVEPHRLEFQRGRWYLVGHDRGRDGLRHFRVDRIDGDVHAGPPGAFERPPAGERGRPTPPWQFGEGPAVTATVLIDAAQAPWAIGQLGAQAVVDERADGSVVVELEVTDRAAFRSFVLTFLDHAEVLGPPELRDDLVGWLTRIAGGAGASP